MKVLPIILVFILVYSACVHTNEPLVQTNGKLSILDSARVTEDLLIYNESFRRAFFPVCYIGEAKDTIRLGTKPVSNSKSVEPKRTFAQVDSTKMKIVVDTSFNLSHTVRYTSLDDIGQQRTDSVKSYKSFAVIVSNLSDSSLFVGKYSAADYTSLGRTVIQAKNSKGEWIDLGKPASHGCVSFGDIVIEPGQILIAKLMRQKGDLKTQCRLKFTSWKKHVYSNVYTDYLSRKQLTDTLRL